MRKEAFASMHMEMNTQKQDRSVQAVLTELVTTWGYRDISSFIAQQRKSFTEDAPDCADSITYLCVLQEPKGGPIYCRSAKRLFKELEVARTRNESYRQCPAPDPAAPGNLWMVIGNFEIDDEEEEHQQKHYQQKH